MVPQNTEEMGFIKYDGKTVSEGVIDAGNAGMALIGLDQAIRYFNERQNPKLNNIEYQLPVQITNGSWKVLILLAIAGSPLAYAYLKKGVETMAQNDFKDIGFKTLFHKSTEALQYLFKLCKHTKKFKNWDLGKVQWQNNNTEVGILNEDGALLFVPIEYIKWYDALPTQIIAKIVGPIEYERKLIIGVKNDQSYEEVTITEKEKLIFVDDDVDVDSEYIFPELKHGEPVKLEGKLTRGNESTNSVGLEYKEHILNCIPDHGSIRRFKTALFLRCSVDGTVSRFTRTKAIEEKKPTIIVHNITPLEEDEQQTVIFKK